MRQTIRIRILSVLFLVTGTAAVFVVLKNSGFVNNGISSVKISLDSATLNKVTLQFNKETTVLTKEERSWRINNKYKARQNPIQLMMVGLSKAEVKRPVAEENKKKVKELLLEKGIIVTAEGDDWKKTFRIMANDNDANSSYYMEEGAPEVYVVYVPGFTGDMSILFKMTEADWRSKELFISTPLSLQQITVDYPAFKDKGIDITWANKTFTIKGIKNIDSTKVITYLAQYEQVNVDHYIYKDKDKIMAELTQNAPQAIVQVSDLDPSGNHKLSLYKENRELGGVYGIVEPGNELVILKKETLQRILVQKDFFEKKK